MAQSKHQFYRKGPDNQKKADITIDLQRPDPKEVINWSQEEKKELVAFFEMADASYQAFKHAILGVCR